MNHLNIKGKKKLTLKKIDILEELALAKFQTPYSELTFSSKLVIRTRLEEWLQILRKARERNQNRQKAKENPENASKNQNPQ